MYPFEDDIYPMTFISVLYINFVKTLGHDYPLVGHVNMYQSFVSTPHHLPETVRILRGNSGGNMANLHIDNAKYPWDIT